LRSFNSHAGRYSLPEGVTNPIDPEKDEWKLFKVADALIEKKDTKRKKAEKKAKKAV
jgi:hypothetical protein